MSLKFSTSSLAVASLMWICSVAQAGLDTAQYISDSGGAIGVDGDVEGNMSGVGAVTILDKDGDDMWTGGDNFTYLFDSNRVQGNFTATVRVISQTEAIDGRWGKSGIRASNDLSGTSAFAMTQVAAGNGSQTGGANPIPVRMAGRPTHNTTGDGTMFESNIAGSPENTFASTGVTPTWLSLDYDAATNTFSSRWAPDASGQPGVWSDPVTRDDVQVPAEGLYVGLAYSAHDDLDFTQVTRADNLHGVVFDNYALIPEPSSMLLIGIGVLGLLGFGWRRRNS